jgi:protein-S-isoprenylcysteine O-methyltransferase Ste14
MGRERLLALVFRHREALLVLLSVPVIASALRGGGTPRTSALLGVGIAASGVLLRLCAVRRIGRGARVFYPHARAGLVVDGPYRWTRNPLYLAAALMLCGLGLIADAGWTAVALLPATLLAYTPVVFTEERALHALFGDAYTRYRAHVPRWIGLARASGALIGWREVFHREKRLVPGMLAAILAIVASRSEWVPLTALARRAELAVGADMMVLVGAATVVAIAINAIKVELHQRRRRESGAAKAAPRARPTRSAEPPSAGPGSVSGQPQLEARTAQR